MLPYRPRFLNELVVVQAGAEVIVDGAAKLQVLKGEMASSLLPRLLPIMDGRRTVSQLQRALADIPRAHVSKAVTLLTDAGLVEDASIRGVHPPGNEETIAFLNRFIGVTRWNANGRAAYERLRRSEICIAEPRHDEYLSPLLTSMLVNSGVGVVTPFRPGAKSAWSCGSKRKGGDRFVLSLSSEGEDPSFNTEVAELCYRYKLSWLRVVVDQEAGYADLGPFFQNALTPCYSCFSQVHSRAPRHRCSTRSAPPTTGAVFWAGMAALEVIYLLTRIGPRVTGRGFRRYDLTTWESKDLPYTRIPGCSRCRPLLASSRAMIYGCSDQDATDTSLVFADAVGLGSGATIDPAAGDENERLGRILSAQAKSLSICPQNLLPRPLLSSGCSVYEALSRTTFGYQEAIDIDRLATILEKTAGIHARDLRVGDAKRWAPSAGNLGSVEIYVAVRNVNGLLPGLYFYQSFEHSLAAVRWRSGGLDINEFIRRSVVDNVAESADRQVPDLLVIFTGALHRLTKKYGAFGYRLLNLDAGVAASQLITVARAMCISARMSRRWADDLIEDQLHLEPPDEQCTICVAVSGNGSTELRYENEIPDRQTPRSQMPAGFQKARDFFELSAPEIAKKLYRESRITEDVLYRQESPTHPGLVLDGSAGSPLIPLPSPVPTSCALLTTLADRRSVRLFSRDTISHDQLSTMLSVSHEVDLCDWPDEHRAGNLLRFLVFAQGVNELPIGVYGYSAAHHALFFRNGMPSPSRMKEMLVQKELASAPLLVWIIGDLATAWARHRAWGHRQLLLRAGAAAHRIYLAALGSGLAGTIAAGLVPGAARLQIGLDGYRHAALCAVVIGREQRS